ncbi:type II secretion system protein [Sandaracinobacteroides sp. A072]|uniref:type II secretion system protein n=1 Tax=Sandaracinobacteroides sp. A072 TaxID=3461146 RepID=UPI004042151A
MKAGAGEQGFALIEMLVAMVLLSLVGLTLARFQTFQLSGTASLAAAAAARLEADNIAIDMLAAPLAPTAPTSGTSLNGGRSWHWTATPAPTPDQQIMPGIVRVDILVSATPGGPPLASRSILRPLSHDSIQRLPETGDGSR